MKKQNSTKLSSPTKCTLCHTPGRHNPGIDHNIKVLICAGCFQEIFARHKNIKQAKSKEENICTNKVCTSGTWSPRAKQPETKQRCHHKPQGGLSGSVIPGGCFPPHVLKRRHEEIKEMIEKGISPDNQS